MANEEHFALLKQGFDVWNKWRADNPNIFPNLSIANLRGAKLRDANLSRVDLSDSNLRSANLRGADFSGANLRSVDFSYANLSGANLRGADLSGADLSSVDLSHANLSDTNLRGVVLRHVNLRSVVLRGADLSHANLSGVDLRDADLSHANLSGVDLRGINLSHANLSHADLHRADLRGTDFSGADLSSVDLTQANVSHANLCGVVLRDANLSGVDLRDANLSGVDLSGEDLSGMDFSGANLSAANLSHANLSGTEFSGANLRGADLRATALIDSSFNSATLTDAMLWETQRGGWSIKFINCQRAFWDRDGKEKSEYRNGEFEHIFAEIPRIKLHYPGGLFLVDLLALPLIIKRLQDEYPESTLQIRSMQDDAGGSSVTIVVEDLADRNAQSFDKELVQIQAKLECVVEERDYLRKQLGPIFLEGMSKIGDLLALPRQEIHVHGRSGLTAIEGPTMSRDNYSIPGQAGAVGPGAQAQHNTFQQTKAGINLPKLADELKQLRAAMKEADDKDDQDEAIGAVAAAEKAAVKGDGPTTLQHLKTAGTWALGIAEKIGVSVAAEAIKRAM